MVAKRNLTRMTGTFAKATQTKTDDARTILEAGGYLTGNLSDEQCHVKVNNLMAIERKRCETARANNDAKSQKQSGKGEAAKNVTNKSD